MTIIHAKSIATFRFSSVMVCCASTFVLLVLGGSQAFVDPVPNQNNVMHVVGITGLLPLQWVQSSCGDGW